MKSLKYLLSVFLCGLFVYSPIFSMKCRFEPLEALEKNVCKVAVDSKSLCENTDDLLKEIKKLQEKLNIIKKFNRVGDLKKSIEKKNRKILFLKQNIELSKFNNKDAKLNLDFKKIIVYLGLISESKKGGKKKKKKISKKKPVKRSYKNQDDTREYRELAKKTKREIQLLFKKIKKLWPRDEK